MIRAIRQWLQRRERRAAMTTARPHSDSRCTLSYFRRANGAR